MSDVSLGSISTEVKLDLDQLKKDTAEAKSVIASMAADLASSLSAMGAKMTQDMQGIAQQQQRAAKAEIEQMSARQKAAQQQALSLAKQVGGQLQMMGTVALGALGAGIMAMIIPGGGGFMKGLLGSLSGGFDEAGNDRTARHWGFDFGDMFTRGIQDSQRSRMAAAGSSGGGSHYAPVINITLPGAVVRQEADLGELSRQMARHVSNTLRARPGSGH